MLLMSDEILIIFSYFPVQQNHNIGKRSAENSDSHDVSAASIVTSGYLMASCGVLALVLSSLAA